MSIFPVFNASFIGLLLVGLFTWNLLFILIVSCCLCISVVLYLYEVDLYNYKYASGFVLFIFSEVMVFGSLLFCCLYFDYNYYSNLSSSLELPFLGCFILLGSSLTVTSYHHLISWNWWSGIPLILTIILGFMFVILQIVEMEEIIVNIYDTTFHASSLCTVGLHFSHVLLGIVGLVVVFIKGLDFLGYYRCSMVVWYWHFVDYVWLFVYTLVYVC